MGLNEGADVLQQAFTELRVVSIYLPGPLGCVDNQGELGVGSFQQGVYRGMGNALRSGVGHIGMLPMRPRSALRRYSQ